MKNLLLFGILIFNSTCLITLNAQSTAGFAIGYTSTHFKLPATSSFHQLGNWTSTGGWTIAMPIEHTISKHLAFQMEVGWIKRGAEVNSTVLIEGIPVNTNVTININYLEIPMMLKIVASILQTKLSILTGTYIATGLTAKLKATAIAGNHKTSTSMDLDFEENLMNRFDAGLILGTEVQLKNKFFLQARYSLGLINIDTSDDDEAVIYNSGLVFSIGKLF